MSTLVLQIDNLCCPAEEGVIKNRLKSVAGIEELKFNVMARQLTVVHRLADTAPIIDALNEIGMGPRPELGERSARTAIGKDHVEGDGDHDEHAPGEHEHETPKGLLAWAAMGVAGVSAVAAEVVAWKTGEESSWPVIGLAVLALVLSGRETLKKGLVALRTRTLNINFLMMVAVAGAIAIGQWPEAAMVTFLFAVAEMIEAYSLDRARNAIRGLMQMTPEKALVKVAGGYEERDAGNVAVDDVVRIRPGERVPLDGTVVSGASSVNQAPITGESVPVEKKVGDKVFAGTINEKGTLDFTVTANRGNTTLDRIVRAVQTAQGERAPTQRFVDRFARVYTPAVLVIAILVAALPPLFFGSSCPGSTRPWSFSSSPAPARWSSPRRSPSSAASPRRRSTACW